MNLGPISISNQTALPGNSQITPVIDTTYWNDSPPWAPAAAAAPPGKSRGQLAGGRITGTITPVAQNATVTFLLLTDPSGTTAAAFEADVNVSGTGGTGSAVITAGSTFTYSWLPTSPDWRVIVTAGATGPTALRTTVNIIWDRTSGA